MSTPTLTPYDPSHEFLFRRTQALDAIFEPKSVAVIGASERQGSVGRTILWNLISSPFGGTVYPVNPKRRSVLGIRAYPSIGSIDETVDLAVLVTPAKSIPSLIRECVEAGVKGAIIISAGFKEVGAEGVALEEQVLAEARKGGMRIIGPNCLGVMRPTSGLNATFARGTAQAGNVAFISQSGALLTAILDWSTRENVGFSAFVSTGSMLDVGWGDLLYYLGDDPKTESILIYMESIGDARSFLSAAREVALRKPIIVIKAGRTEEAAKAAASHTGTLAGSDEVLSAAFRRSGVLRVNSIADVFYMAEVLAKQPRPRGPRLTILTNAGGPGVLATDQLVSGGGALTDISDEAMDELNTFLPSAWSHGNPVDILGDAGPDRYAKALEVAGRDKNSDGLLVILTPQDMTDPTETARQLQPYAQMPGKPVLASWMGGAFVEEGEQLLNEAGIPTFQYPDTAMRVFNYMWRYSYNLRGLYQTPSLPSDLAHVAERDEADALITEAHANGHTILSEYASKRLLAAYGIPTVETRLAHSADEAVAQAEDIGYPVVVKLHSHTITHKKDVGGVRLNLRSADDVRHAYQAIQDRIAELGHPASAFEGVTVQPMLKLDGLEVIIGSSLDEQFGPVLLFGSGGSLVEVYKDRALALPPLNTTLARRMMEQTKIYEALHGVRGAGSVDMDALEGLMVKFSQLVVEQPRIKEIDINPLLASETQLIALDARVVLHPPEVDLKTLPKPAIRPYPHRYVSDYALADGATVTIRPIRPEDEPALVAFHHRLSEQSVYMRYASLLKVDQRIAHDRLARICFIDYDREMALVAEDADGALVAVGRLTQVPGTNDAEFAMLIQDDYQRRGLGTELLRRLVQVGRDEGLDHITADILWRNRGMQQVAQKLDFQIVRPDPDDEMAKAVLRLR
ncbi:MAG: bifunctional acetate--CoA ligase family protein/GNAT family N-acetyltransferase [Bacteroidota bacterium]